MRHRKKINHLGRKSQHRQALLSNMAASLILHKRIFTTVAKAKALKVYVEPLITKCKEDSTHSRRVVFSYLGNKYAVSELFREISPKVADRPGGYTRILKTGFRQGDGAEMCMMELVDYNPNLTSKSSENQGKKTRRAGRRKKSDAVPAVAAAVAKETVKEELPVEEVVAKDLPVEEAVVVNEVVAEADTPETSTETESAVSESVESQAETEVGADDSIEEEKK